MAALPVMAILTLASTAAAVYGSYQSAQAQEAGYQAQAQASEYNATIANQNATVARQQASAREEAQRRQARQILGEQRAALGQAGIGLSGSAADVYGRSAANAELDALNIRYDGELDARGLLAQSELGRYEGKVGKMNAKSAKAGGYVNMASNMLSGGANAYGQYKGVG